MYVLRPLSPPAIYSEFWPKVGRLRALHRKHLVSFPTWNSEQNPHNCGNVKANGATLGLGRWEQHESNHLLMLLLFSCLQPNTIFKICLSHRKTLSFLVQTMGHNSASKFTCQARPSKSHLNREMGVSRKIKTLYHF